MKATKEREYIEKLRIPSKIKNNANINFILKI
jgi:hypothetical protein